jgi:hypothetical protein
MRKYLTAVLFIHLLSFSQTAVAPAIGDGSGSNPYQIASLENLYWIAVSNSEWSKEFVLTEDIDASPTSEWFPDGEGGFKGWIPIGTFENSFTGYFNGDNKTISGLYINRPEEDNIGLFGRIGEIIVENVNVTEAAITGRNFVGGIAGVNFMGSIEYCFFTGSVDGEYNVGGITGYNYNGYVFNSHYDFETVKINGGSYITEGALYKNMFDDWLNNGKYLDITDYSSTLVPSGDFYDIHNIQGLKDILGFAFLTGRYFRLMSDIDLADSPGFFIPFLNTRFYGNHNRIINLSIDVPFNNNIGMFGTISPYGGCVTDLGIIDANVNGYDNTGALAGMVRWWFINSCAVSSCYSKGGSINGNSGVGGLIGSNGERSGVVYSYSESSVKGSEYTGGFVGYNAGYISDCYSKGPIQRNEGSVSTLFGGFSAYNQSAINKCYSTGSITYLSETDPTDKGFCGEILISDSFEMDGNFWDTETSLQSSSSGTAYGKSSNEMKTQNTFTDSGWDFAETWKMDTELINEGYPVLKNTFSGIDLSDFQTHHSFQLFQNYPNPFNPVTQIRFALAKTAVVRLSVFNIAGQKVAELVNGSRQAGINTVDFDGSKLNSGIYYYTLEVEDKSITKKMLLVK